MGTKRPDLFPAIRRSDDGGITWTTPADEESGLLRRHKVLSAPVPVVLHDQRFWRAYEGRGGTQDFVMSAPADADLLKAKNWTFSKPISIKKPFAGKWLEGNVVPLPDGSVADIFRLGYPGGHKAAMVHFNENGEPSWDPDKDLIDFPGGQSKFTIRYDPVSKRYWSLVDLLPFNEAERQASTLSALAHTRNVLGLIESADARSWSVRTVVLNCALGDRVAGAANKVGFQYVDWQFDGADIIAASRTAWGKEVPRSHDANYLTFHRIRDFRNLKVKSLSPY